MDYSRNYGTNGANKHKRICQQPYQEKLSEQVYLDQHATMRAGLKYDGQDHEKAVKCIFTINKLMIYLAENTTKFTVE